MTNADNDTYPPSPYGAPPTYGTPAASTYGTPAPSPYGSDSYAAPPANEYKISGDVYTAGTDYHHHHHDVQYAQPQFFVLRYVTPHSRNKFVAKVYAIVSFQLFLVSLLCAPVVYSQSVRDFVDINTTTGLSLYITDVVLEFVFLCILFFVRKKPVPGAVALIAFTLATGYIIGVACSYVNFQEIVEAAVITFAIVVAILVYCLFTKVEFNFLFPFLLCMLNLLLFWTLWSMWFWIFGWEYEWMYQLYCVIGIFIFIGYLLFDTSRIVNRIPEDEYILAAVTIYLDILNLFLLILSLLKR